ncbi:MAG: LUD domain-containing protein, partial [Nevskiales bacterium]
MQVTSSQFKQTASQKLADPKVQKALKNAKGKLVVARAKSILELDNFEEIREAAARIRDFGLLNLEALLEQWEKNAKAAGAIVHWAETPQDVNRLVIEIAQKHKVRKIIKSKSMLGEETNLNHVLAAAGLDVRETDLGEYIIQLAGEMPSHIIAPAVHKTKEQVSDLFHRHHFPLGKTERLTDGQAMVNEAREVLRQKYIDADVG